MSGENLVLITPLSTSFPFFVVKILRLPVAGKKSKYILHAPAPCKHAKIRTFRAADACGH